MRISSTEEISKELVGILSSRNFRELKISINKDKIFWLSIFKTLKDCKFTQIDKFRNYSHHSNYSYVSLPLALSLIRNLNDNCDAYGTVEMKEKKFKQLLNALSFLDSGLLLSLLFRKFKWELVERLLTEEHQ